MSKQIEIRKRIQSIATQLESGHTSSEVIKDCMEQWKISSRTVERYITIAAKMVIQKMDEENTNNEAKRLIEIIEKSGLQMINPKLEEILNKFKKVPQ